MAGSCLQDPECRRRVYRVEDLEVYYLRMQPAVIKDVLLDIVMFPVWWYSRGLILMLRRAADTLKGYAKYMAIGVWIQNMFVPMFGQHDWQSRLISIFMRLVQIVGRSFGLMIIAIMVIGALGLYITLPIFLCLQAAYHVIGSFMYVS